MFTAEGYPCAGETIAIGRIYLYNWLYFCGGSVGDAAGKKIELLWWGKDEIPLREVLDQYRKGSDIEDDFVFTREEDEVVDLLRERDFNVLFINRTAQEINAFLEKHGELIGEKLLMATPMQYYMYVDQRFRVGFDIRPYLFFTAEDGLYNLAGYLERELCAGKGRGGGS